MNKLMNQRVNIRPNQIHYFFFHSNIQEVTGSEFQKDESILCSFNALICPFEYGQRYYRRSDHFYDLLCSQKRTSHLRPTHMTHIVLAA